MKIYQSQVTKLISYVYSLELLKQSTKRRLKPNSICN